jgi:hypothetical protein
MKFIVLGLAILFAGMRSGCEGELNRGLQEQKSYTRAAMEKYRQDPKVFQGSSPDVLEIWSRMDYVATAVAQRDTPGTWANTADKLNFLQPKIQRDTTDKPFCVIQQKNIIVLARILSESMGCTTELIAQADTSRIPSGDMEFSGRSDYWIYVLRLPSKGGTEPNRESQ